MDLLKWSKLLIEAKKKYRKKLVQHCLNAIRHFEKGEQTEAGEECYKFLMQADKQLVGFVPFISYIMHDHKDESNLDTLWVHPFSIPTLLYHIKGTPFLLLANSNLDYNNSKLLEIDHNKHLEKYLREALGLQG